MRLNRAERKIFAVPRFVHVVARHPAVQLHFAALNLLSRRVTFPPMIVPAHEARRRTNPRRDIDPRRFGASNQRGENRNRREHRAGQIGNLHAGRNRRTTCHAVRRQQTRERDIVQIVPSAISIRTVVLPAERTVDNARVERRESVVADAPPIRRARAKCFDDDVGILRQAQKNFFAACITKVERDTFLVAIDIRYNALESSPVRGSRTYGGIMRI